MQLQVKAQNASVPDSVHAYTEKRLSKLSRRLYEGTVVEVTFSRQRNPSIADDHLAEGVVHTKGGHNLVAREAAATFEAAVDRLVDKLERQMERYRDKMAALGFDLSVQSVEETRALLKSPLYFDSIVEPTTSSAAMASRAAGETPRRGGFITTASNFSPAPTSVVTISAASPVRASSGIPCASAAVRASATGCGTWATG